MRKRYSSSFPHRYGSVGSGGSGDSGSASGSVLPPRERTSSGSRSGSFLKGAPAAADAQHDDIASYVQDIDAARPLLGRYRLEQQQGEAPVAAAASRLDEDRPGSRQSEGGSSSPGTSRGGTVRGSSTAAARTVTLDAHAGSGSGGAMLTSESEVDERLRRMNEEFARSLVGLGRRGSH
ncbi:hypothetical protein B0H15DRAFT_858750 [Mycena belliarum]|uniref:Uncharacterized protein n=1 Tax=Mycena belliarum TaxID=1033014 RepID=A0AAD6TZE5_9AGAR|nr:hypothetical protein B0H15DRAFT_858750 [Mycena belliae]